MPDKKPFLLSLFLSFHRWPRRGGGLEGRGTGVNKENSSPVIIVTRRWSWIRKEGAFEGSEKDEHANEPTGWIFSAARYYCYVPAPLPPPGCVCFPATCICKYRVCEHVSLSRRARLRPRIHRGMKREKGRERSILLPARDETKGKLTSAQWFSLLSRNCFQTFVSYRWKRRTMWKETFSFFFFLFS